LGTQLNLNTDTVGSIVVGLPPLDEQKTLSDFLDDETGRIDLLINEKQELIDRLKEKRSALISRTVTRGLPPEAARAAGLSVDPPLKPSGIGWLGDIPTHWEAAQLRRKSHVIDCKHRTVPFIDDGIPVASIREVHDFEVNLTNAKQTSDEEYLALIEGGRRPRVGDIIYSRNATVGDAALVTTTERFCMGQDVCLIRAPKQIPKFLLYLFRAEPLIQQVESLMIGSTFRRINVGQIQTFWICVPPVTEQIAIVAFLDTETAKLDGLTVKIESAIERLQEYRAALINAAVTGKIDLRKAIA
jgi:type I restriction enzyme S subunit